MTDELSKGFTGIEINGVRFSNIKEMLIYMDKQRDHILELEKENAELKDALKGKRCSCMTYLNFKDLEKQLTKAKQIIRDLINLTEPTSTEEVQHWNETFRKAEQFIKDSEGK